jgi:hypothetical protein
MTIIEEHGALSSWVSTSPWKSCVIWYSYPNESLCNCQLIFTVQFVMKPPTKHAADGTVIVSEFLDISHCVRTEPIYIITDGRREVDQKSTRYVKARDSTLSDCESDVVFKYLGSENASFEGTYSHGPIGAMKEYTWLGVAAGKQECTVQNSVVDIPRPSDAQSSLSVLSNMKPFASKTENGYRQGQDMAQISGDQLMFKVSSEFERISVVLH